MHGTKSSSLHQWVFHFLQMNLFIIRYFGPIGQIGSLELSCSKLSLLVNLITLVIAMKQNDSISWSGQGCVSWSVCSNHQCNQKRKRKRKRSQEVTQMYPNVRTLHPVYEKGTQLSLPLPHQSLLVIHSSSLFSNLKQTEITLSQLPKA